MKRILSLLFAVILAVSLAGCDEVEVVQNSALIEQGSYDASDTWAIYWYLCGSDLESDGGMASVDLEEMMSVQLPENVRVVVQAGGSSYWDNDYIDPEKSTRLLYDSEGLSMIGQGPVVNMGDEDTLADFLTFCTENYPADHQVVIFWDHGSGSVGGVASDEQFDWDTLTLDEIYGAFDKSCAVSEEAPPFEVVGFDACLMATIDTAYWLYGTTRYMVASQELVPGIGWDYTGIMRAFSDGETMNGARFGKVICDTYAQSCIDAWLAGDITMSVVDITRLQPLVTAYHNFGVEALVAAGGDSAFFSRFSRGANASENYGGNTRDDGYTNMVDLGDLARNNSELLPQYSGAVLQALSDCVVYKINGSYRAQSSGLSCYHGYNSDMHDEFAYVAASEAHAYLYEYGATGTLSAEAASYIRSLEYEPLGDVAPEITAPEPEDFYEPESVVTLDLEDYPVYVSDDGYAVLDLGPEIADQLTAVYFQLCYMSYEDDIILLLGSDSDLDADWENGVFLDNFRGVWGAIDGCLVYMEILYEGEDYNLYTVPIKLNGEECNLRVAYSFVTEEYTILGARRGIVDDGMPDKNLVLLTPGDVVTTMHYATIMSDPDDEFTLVPIDEIVITEHTRFHEEDLGDGEFIMMYEMVDSWQESALSDIVVITVEGEDIYLSESE